MRWTVVSVVFLLSFSAHAETPPALPYFEPFFEAGRVIRWEGSMGNEGEERQAIWVECTVEASQSKEVPQLSCTDDGESALAAVFADGIRLAYDDFEGEDTWLVYVPWHDGWPVEGGTRGDTESPCYGISSRDGKRWYATYECFDNTQSVRFEDGKGMIAISHYWENGYGFEDYSLRLVDHANSDKAHFSTQTEATKPSAVGETAKQASPIDDGDWVRFEPGSFTMGSPEGELGRDDDELPHEVSLSRPFALAKRELTQDDWAKVFRNLPSKSEICSSCPVESISWFDALAYANALSTAHGLEACYDLRNCTGEPGTKAYACDGEVSWIDECTGYRLPTEAEWEYANRAGASSSLPNGELTSASGADATLDRIAWYDKNSGKKPHPTASKEADVNGVFDMNGNVWEWTWDGYAPYPEGAVSDPRGDDSASDRVYRGGCHKHPAKAARSANRGYDPPAARYDGLGMRLARTLTE